MSKTIDPEALEIVQRYVKSIYGPHDQPEQEKCAADITALIERRVSELEDTVACHERLLSALDEGHEDDGGKSG